MLKSIILRTLPSELRTEFLRLHPRDNEEARTHTTMLEVSMQNVECDPQIKQVIMFIKREVESLEMSRDLTMRERREMPKRAQTYGTATGLLTYTRTSPSTQACTFCNSNDHPTQKCQEPLSLAQKKERLKSGGNCFRCTERGHSSKFCKKKSLRCEKCQGRHVSIMCDPEYFAKMKTHNTSSKSTNINKSEHSVSLFSSSTREILLKTARAFVATYATYEQLLIRLIIDGGSQISFIREDVSRKLNLPVIGTRKLSIIPFGVKCSNTSKMYQRVEVNLKSQYNDDWLQIEAIEVPQICMDVLVTPNVNSLMKMTSELQLADVCVANVQQVDGISILIGADNYWRVVTGEHKLLSDNLAVVNTKFGWTLHGQSLNVSSDCTAALNINFIEEENVNVENLWNLELIGINSNERISDDKLLSEFMEKSVSWKCNRYEVPLLFKGDVTKLHDNYITATIRLKTLMYKLAKNEAKLLEYDRAMWDLIETKVAEPVDSEVDTNLVYYMPHRPVYRSDKSTSRVRIVFDASSHIAGFPSLNESLNKGPNLLPDLLIVLVSFRLGSIGIIADIEKAFLQISLRESQRDCQRFLWYERQINPGEDLPKVKIYRTTRVIFGVSCSPFLLGVTIKKHLKTKSNLFPDTCQALDRNLYVDDLVISVDNITEGVKLYNESKTIMSSASMNLRKWNSNHEGLNRTFNDNGDNEGTCKRQKVLGINWCTLTDEISTDLSSAMEFSSTVTNASKRNVLKTISRIFDPLGLIVPFTVRLRLLFQSIWKLNLSWDASLPNDLLQNWRSWTKDLQLMADFLIPRYIFNDCIIKVNDTIELHVFADASPKAYGAAAYVRRVNEDGTAVVNLLCAKGRIAPLKTSTEDNLSLPKLELTAALIASRLKSHIVENLNIQFNKTYMWTDSKITLHWIFGKSNKWKQYIAHRVEEIHRRTNEDEWHHVPGIDNPADLLTRGVTAKELISSVLWKSGPSWLKFGTKNWPKSGCESSVVAMSLAAIELDDDKGKQLGEPVMSLESYSNLTNLLRVTAYVLRFARIIKVSGFSSFLTTEELTIAERYWIKYEQQREFYEEIKALNNNNNLPRRSSILTLHPYLDIDKILRVGSRLGSTGEDEIAFPIILPKRSHFSTLVIRQVHNQMHHSGTNAVLAKVREKFWIVKGRQLIKNVISRCLICKRLQGKAASQPFSPLPRDRISASRPFEVTGVDFAGPLFVKDSSQNQTKIYLMLFTCAAIRAVHLELVTRLTTESCLSAMRRFISRRGVPNVIYSDNARTFKRADYEIKELFKQLKTESFMFYTAQQGVRWKFIVERAPWWGGWWERMVRSIKTALKATIGRYTLTTEQLQTTIIEIESTINSRPLTYQTDDSRDPKPITPAQFLSPATQFSLPNVDAPSNKDEVRSLWKQRQRIAESFWKRWTVEYLHQLRSAHHHPVNFSSSIKPGDVVLVYEAKTPRLLWKMAIVETVYPGRDNKIRACEVRLTNQQRLRRSIQHLFPLEIQ